jgi:two-component system clock-associated histidine kinase SasA
LEKARGYCAFELQVIDIGEHPYLAEHFRLVASPALVKIFPEPRSTIAGSNLIPQIETFWPQWLRAAQDLRATAQKSFEEPTTFGQTATKAHFQYPTGAAIHKNGSDSAEASQPNSNEGQVYSSQSSNFFAYTTELLRLSDEIFRLKQEKEELQEQLSFKDRVIAMLAHDLRNPLTAASIAMETLELGFQSKADEKNYSRLTPEMTLQLLKHARTQTRAIDRMITDILQGARDKGAKLRVQPQVLELGTLCGEVLEFVHEQVQAKHQMVEADIPNDLPQVYADPERIRQVLINLLDNAIKYTPDGGGIQVSILHRTMQKVQMSICDTGPGIPEESQQHIFEDHFRLQRDTEKAGYGIGLSLCQRIIRAHYGQIWVDSVPGQGSCFHFTLPVYRR